jgi:hypothetical protein
MTDFWRWRNRGKNRRLRSLKCIACGCVRLLLLLLKFHLIKHNAYSQLPELNRTTDFDVKMAVEERSDVQMLVVLLSCQSMVCNDLGRSKTVND